MRYKKHDSLYMITITQNFTSASEISISVLCKMCFAPALYLMCLASYAYDLSYAGTITSSIHLVKSITDNGLCSDVV